MQNTLFLFESDILKGNAAAGLRLRLFDHGLMESWLKTWVLLIMAMVTYQLKRFE